MANGLTNVSGGKALSGTAQPSDVRLGMTYADGKELREGMLDLRNLKAENIKKDVNIAGVVGNVQPLAWSNVKKQKRSVSWQKTGSSSQTESLILPAYTFAVELNGLYRNGSARSVGMQTKIAGRYTHYYADLKDGTNNELPLRFVINVSNASFTKDILKAWIEGNPIEVYFYMYTEYGENYLNSITYYYYE